MSEDYFETVQLSVGLRESILEEEESMSAGTVNAEPVNDISDDLMEQLLFQQQGAFDELALEIEANSNMASAGLQFGQTAKFNQIDPMESASAEKILGK